MTDKGKLEIAKDRLKKIKSSDLTNIKSDDVKFLVEKLEIAVDALELIECRNFELVLKDRMLTKKPEDHILRDIYEYINKVLSRILEEE